MRANLYVLVAAALVYLETVTVYIKEVYSIFMNYSSLVNVLEFPYT